MVSSIFSMEQRIYFEMGKPPLPSHEYENWSLINNIASFMKSKNFFVTVLYYPIWNKKKS